LVGRQDRPARRRSHLQGNALGSRPGDACHAGRVGGAVLEQQQHAAGNPGWQARQDRHLTLRLAATLAALAWGAAASAHADEAIKPGVDYHSFANVNEFRVKHVSLDLDVSFPKKQLSGHVDLTVLRESPSARVLVLDSRDLDIRSVALIGRGGAK